MFLFQAVYDKNFSTGDMGNDNNLFCVSDNSYAVVVKRKSTSYLQARLVIRQVCLAPFRNISTCHGFLGMGQS